MNKLQNSGSCQESDDSISRRRHCIAQTNSVIKKKSDENSKSDF